MPNSIKRYLIVFSSTDVEADKRLSKVVSAQGDDCHIFPGFHMVKSDLPLKDLYTKLEPLAKKGETLIVGFCCKRERRFWYPDVICRTTGRSFSVDGISRTRSSSCAFDGTCGIP
jgi:hypothetical protein